MTVTTTVLQLMIYIHVYIHILQSRGLLLNPNDKYSVMDNMPVFSSEMTKYKSYCLL